MTGYVPGRRREGRLIGNKEGRNEGKECYYLIRGRLSGPFCFSPRGLLGRHQYTERVG